MLQPGCLAVSLLLVLFLVDDALGVGEGACYSNSADADEHLSKQSEAYMGGHAILYHDRCACTHVLFLLSFFSSSAYALLVYLCTNCLPV